MAEVLLVVPVVIAPWIEPALLAPLYQCDWRGLIGLPTAQLKSLLLLRATTLSLFSISQNDLRPNPLPGCTSGAAGCGGQFRAARRQQEYGCGCCSAAAALADGVLLGGSGCSAAAAGCDCSAAGLLGGSARLAWS